MSWCGEITSDRIYKLNDLELNNTLDNCESNCDRYYQCDSVALMNDLIKKLRGEYD